MSNYSVNNSLGGTQQAISTTYITLQETIANTTGIKRFHIYGYKIFPVSAPASSDTDLEYDISRITASGTGTAATSLPNDSAESASNATSKVNDTVEPTVTASSSVDYGGGNQRATIQFQTNDFSQMFHAPATNANGFAIRAKSLGYTGKMGAWWAWME
jgi:hypothetical protein